MTTMKHQETEHATEPFTTPPAETPIAESSISPHDGFFDAKGNWARSSGTVAALMARHSARSASWIECF